MKKHLNDYETLKTGYSTLFFNVKTTFIKVKKNSTFLEKTIFKKYCFKILLSHNIKL